MTKLLAASLVVGLTMPAPLAAQPGQPPAAVSDLLKCRAIADESERLRCFDSTSASLEGASRSGAVVILDREEVRRTRRSLFGFSLPRLPLFNGDDSQDEQPDEIEATIKSLRHLGYGKWTIDLDSGGRWQTTETSGFQRSPRAGDRVKIKRGVAGNYFIIVAGGRAVRGMRVG